MSSTKGRHSHESVEHYSPQWLVEGARYTVGGRGFDLDPASSMLANERVGAERILTGPGGESDRSPEVGQAGRVFAVDGLQSHWARPGVQRGASVFCNPPTPAAKWWAKACHELAIGNAECIVFVAFSVELLQTAQSVAPHVEGGKLWHPLDFMCCFPEKRVAYDQRIEDRIAIVEKHLIHKPLTVQREAALMKRRDELRRMLANGVKLVSGDSPPHSSAIVLMQQRTPPPWSEASATLTQTTRDRLARFRERFASYGYIHEGRS